MAVIVVESINIHLLVDSGLGCSVFIYQWPIPENHVVYKQFNRSVRHGNIHELLQLMQNSGLCEGLPDIDEVKDVVIDSTTQVQLPGTIVRHSVRKQITTEEPNFEVSVFLRSVDCRVIKETAHDSCQPCTTAMNAIRRANRRKSKASTESAKPNASLDVDQRNFELLSKSRGSSARSLKNVWSTSKLKFKKTEWLSVHHSKLIFSKQWEAKIWNPVPIWNFSLRYRFLIPRR